MSRCPHCEEPLVECAACAATRLGWTLPADTWAAAMTFTVEGPPVPKARARRGRNGKWYTPEATRRYEAAVAWSARAAGIRQPWAGPVRATLRLWLPDRRRRDVDNCAKAILDALNGIAWTDDSQVLELRVVRAVDRTRPRAEVILAPLTVRDVLADEAGQWEDPDRLPEGFS